MNFIQCIKPTKKGRKIVTLTIGLLIGALALFSIWHKPDIKNTLTSEALKKKQLGQPILAAVNQLVSVSVTPDFHFRYSIMKPGVLQHLDREFTYDVIPEELMNGWLFQGIHEPPINTRVRIELHQSARIYIFFHNKMDGGYRAIFSQLIDWQRSASAPQYDVRNGDHGLNMLMYQRDAKPGIYLIPATTKNDACFSIVFRPL